jgi:hypothetical protein
VKKDFWGRLFKTWHYKSLVRELDRHYSGERKQRMQSPISEYNKQLDEILRKTPLSKEEQEKYLDETYLCSLNTEDYFMLMRRLSGYFLAHVTRYGVREQVFSEHNKGEGEFHDAFVDILEKKKLQSFFSNFIENPEQFQGMKPAISEMIAQGESREDIKDKIRRGLAGLENMPADRDSVHFAGNDTGEALYGSEVGYNFYFYYPAEVIAYNYFYSSKDAMMGLKQGDSYRRAGIGDGGYDKDNDISVWNGDEGIAVDAGIVCITGDVQVDRETGSKYKLDENKNPIINRGNIQKLTALSEDEIFLNFAEKVIDPRQYNHNSFQEKQKEYLDLLQRKFGISEQRLQKIATAPDFIGKIRFADDPEWKREIIHSFLLRNGLLFEKAEDTISSKEFWEKYFLENPDRKPSKIFYGHLETAPLGPDYSDLFEHGLFYETKHIPGYREFYTETMKKIDAILDKLYDEVILSKE